MFHKQTFCFNLVELLLVMAILSVLASLFFPALKKTADRSEQLTCLNQLRKVSHGFAFFSLDNDNKLPYGSWGNNSERVFRSWEDFIQPYFGKEPITALEADQLRIPKSKVIEELICPSSLVGRHQEKTLGINKNFAMPMRAWRPKEAFFVANATTGGLSVEPEFRPLVEIEDPGHTILLAEMDVRQVHFVQGVGRLVSSAKRQVDVKSSGLSDSAIENTSLLLHPNSELGYLFVDGHVEADIFSSPTLIGKGTVEVPLGAWTVQRGD